MMMGQIAYLDAYGDEPPETLVFAGGVGRGEGRTRAAKGVRGLGHGPAVDRHPPEHCVSDLQEIAHIEKVGGVKKPIVDRIGTGIEGSMGTECVLFDTAYRYHIEISYIV